jgi:hypothetical protein
MTKIELKELLTDTTADPEAIRNDAPHKHETWAVGDVAHQGDVIFVNIGGLPGSAKTRKNRQLADGDTQGSRHICEGGDVYECRDTDVIQAIKRATGVVVNDRYIGPVFCGPATVTHPEHGDHVFPAKCVNAVVIQRALDMEEREIRVAD